MQERIKGFKIKWSDQLLKQTYIAKIWKLSFFLLFSLTALAMGHNLWLQRKNDHLERYGKHSIILTPAVRERIVIENGSSVSDHYIMAAARKVVEIKENWTYEDVEEKYQELFKFYTSDKFEAFLKANLMQSDFFNKVRKHRMNSIFHFKRKASEATWCKELNAACAVVVGKRTVFKDGNYPLSSKDVGYLIISGVAYPTEERPGTLMIQRLILEDQEADPLKTLGPLLQAAKRGIVPERNQHASA